MKLIESKISLRSIEEKDFDILRKMINDPDIKKMTVGDSEYITVEQHEKWFRNLKNEKNKIRFMIDLENLTIGTIILEDIDIKNKSASVSIKICEKNLKGKGYGTEALKVLLEYAFNELKLHRVCATVLEYNEASKRLFEKCKFRIEGIEREAAYKEERFYNLVHFSILKEEFING